MDFWESAYQYLHITGVMHYVSSAQLQNEFLIIKIIFIAFTVLLFTAVLWFYINSTYIKYQFLQDTVEFLSWQPYGLRQVSRTWDRIVERTETGGESDFKMAIIEADELLFSTMEERGYKGETFEELLESVGRKISPSPEEIRQAHAIRNSIVYDVNYKLNMGTARKVLADYEKAVKNM
jgi:hypothetical protein